MCLLFCVILCVCVCLSSSWSLLLLNLKRDTLMCVRARSEDDLPCKNAMIGLARDFVAAQHVDLSFSSSIDPPQLFRRMHQLLTPPSADRRIATTASDDDHATFTKKDVKLMKTATLRETLVRLGASKQGTRKELMARLLAYASDATGS